MCFDDLDWSLESLGSLVSQKPLGTLWEAKVVQVPAGDTHKLSSCGHLICSKCLESMFAQSMRAMTPFSCPQCRKVIPYFEVKSLNFSKKLVHSSLRVTSL